MLQISGLHNLYLFKEMVDLQRPIFLKFSFHDKPSIIILTIISTKKFWWNVETPTSYL